MWGEVAEGLVGAHGVVDTLPSQQLPIQGSHLQGEVVDLIELLGMGALSPLHTTVELGGAGWEHEEPDTPLPAGFLETRLELKPPSTWMACTGKGILSSTAFKKVADVFAVARVWASTTSQRETTSLAVKCFSTMPRSGRTSRVSTWTRSPGSFTPYPLGLRTA